MTYDPEKYHRHSIRLKEYDYSQSGLYFITICTHQYKCLFGSVKNGEMVLNNAGLIVKQEWLNSAKIRSEIMMDYFVIMPNHIHAIVIIPDAHVGASGARPIIYNGVDQDDRRSPLQTWPLGPKSHSIAALIAGFKSFATRRIRQECKIPAPFWQRNYFEHIIRNQNSLNKILEYIIQNPVNWSFEKDHDNFVEFVSSLNRL